MPELLEDDNGRLFAPGRHVPVPEGMFTMRQLAKEAGVAYATIVKRQNKGQLVPAKRVNGVCFYTAQQVAEQKALTEKNNAVYNRVQLPKPPKPEKLPAWALKKNGTCYTGEEASRVFPYLDQGLSLIEIVIKTKIHPENVQAIAEKYEALKSCIVLSKDFVKQLEEMPLDATFPITSDVQLFAAIGRTINSLTCPECFKNERARTCLPCMVKAKQAKKAGFAPAKPVRPDVSDEET